MITSRPKFVTEEHLVYLDELRESGDTNMYAARPFIEDKFPEMSHDEAGVLLTYWMRSFVIRQQMIQEAEGGHDA
jgi:hypothetical protein